jgi:hypothetical protein
MTTEDIIVWRNIAIIPCIVAVLWFLAVVLCREWVKSDLRNRASQPIKVRWLFSQSSRITCAFRVVYLDLQGRIHRADCQTGWLYKNVIWFGDEIIGDTHKNVV